MNKNKYGDILYSDQESDGLITDKLNDYSSDTNAQSAPNTNTPISGSPLTGPNVMGTMHVPFGDTDEENAVPEMLINLNEKAKSFDKALFRDDILNKMISVLHNLKHPNPLLIGEAGVGKTQVVEELARRIVLEPNTIPSVYRDTVIYELPITSIVAGGGMVGEIESRVEDVITFASEPENHAIIYIDEIHQLYSKTSSTYTQIAQQLKPAMARGDLHIIASTTTQEGRRLQSDPAINRRFSKINVPELTKEQTLEILELVRTKYESHNNIVIPKSLLEDIVELADDHIHSARPDSALTLIDQASSSLFIKSDLLNRQQNAGVAHLKLTINNLKDAVAQITSHKPSNLASKADLFKALQSVVKGQDIALEDISDAIVRKQLNLIKTKKPLSVLLYGPTGTGKTEIGKQVAKNIFGSESDMIYLNMTEFSNSATLSKLTGSPDGYVNSDSNQKLPLDELETNPAQVIILDEFEKASNEVQNFFMQALDEGEVSTQRGNIIDFSKAIVIATSNAGQIIESSVGFASPSKQVTKSKQLESLSASFKMELLNRFNKVIRIDSISRETYKDILKSKYNRLVSEIMASNPKYEFNQLEFNDASGAPIPYQMIDNMTEDTYSPELNGRPAEREMLQYIENLILDNPGQTKFTIQ